MEQNEEEHGGSCGLRITRDQSEFGFYSKCSGSHFKILSKSEVVRVMFQMGSILLPVRNALLRGRGGHRRLKESTVEEI